MLHTEFDPQTGRLFTPVSSYARATLGKDDDKAVMWSSVTDTSLTVLPQLARLPDGTVFVVAFHAKPYSLVWGY